MQPNARRMLLWLMLAGLIALLIGQCNDDRASRIPVSQLIIKIAAGDIEAVILEGADITGVIKGGQQAVRAYAADEAVRQEIVRVVLEHRVPFNEVPPSDFVGSLVSIFMIGGLIIMLLFMVTMIGSIGKQMGNGITSFGRSRAKKFGKEAKTGKTFADVAGIDEAVEEVTDIKDFLANPKKFERLGGRMPKGVLLVGPPGTGKTLLAKAVAGEAGVAFFSLSGSEFVEMFVGVGASRVRDLFETAKKDAPCIIFIDEIDAVGGHRGATFAGGHDERGQTLNQLLVEMDGFEASTGVIVMAATNKPEMLDSALTRAGRFDRQVVVPLPDVKGREAILKVHSRKLLLGADADLHDIARGTPGMTGADLEELLNEAALAATKADKDAIGQSDLEEAKDKVFMGAARKSAVMTEKEKRLTAYHEGGHTIVGHFTPGADPVHKVTIIPRGMALGLTQSLPEHDRRSHSKSELIGLIDMLMGGRAAEELVFADVTTGASNDLERATEIARKMICDLGMSEVLGPLTYGKRNNAAFPGLSDRDFGETAANAIDSEKKRLVGERYLAVLEMLKQKRSLLDKLAAELIEKETLDAKDIERILGPRVI